MFLNMNTALSAQVLDIDDAFRARGMHCTPQRRQVWRFFADHPQGHTIGESVEALHEVGIGQATVYRTVLLLMELRLLSRLQDPDGRTYFMAARPGHSHPLICSGCREVVEFDACDLSVLEKLLAVETGYAIARHRLEIYGLCPKCQRENGSQLAR